MNIYAENPLWFQVQSTDSAHGVSGWIRKEAMLPQAWKKQSSSTTDYRFETAGRNFLAAIRVIDKANDKPLQIITDIPHGHAADDSLQTGDYNFDGHPDLRLQPAANPYTRNRIDQYYLYDAKAKLFKSDSLLSNLPNLKFDQKNKTIQSTTIRKYNSGQKVQRFRWKDGILE